MPAPRKPTAILTITGKRNPARLRAREGEPVPDAGIGPAPAHMSAVEAAVWDELVSIIPSGVMGNTDRIALEHLARLVAESRGDRSKWTSAREKDLLSYLSRFGMTPSDRSRVQAPKTTSKNPFEAFL